MGEQPGAEIEDVFRRVSGQAVATLIRWCGDISVAEDAVQEAFVVAMRRWPVDGVPPNPAGWIVTTARRRGTDQLRRARRGKELEGELHDRERVEQEHADLMAEAGEPTAVVGDDQLRLMFTCCHPSIRSEHQVALTLRLLGGLGVAEIAASFLVSEAAMARRLTRAKFKIAAANIPYRVPGTDELPGRLQSVLSVLYLIYNAGTDDLEAGVGLRREAIRLVRDLVKLMDDEPEASGLLALLLLNESRVPSRTVDGAVVLLRDQDRSKWRRVMITEGHDIVRRCIDIGRPGTFQLQAAIQAVHCDANSFGDTDWAQIVQLYDHLMAMSPSPVVAMNRAIAVGEYRDPESALAELAPLHTQLSGYALWHAARASLLRVLDREVEAQQAYASARDLSTSARDRRFFAEQAMGPTSN